jgi:hypothetical protein
MNKHLESAVAVATTLLVLSFVAAPAMAACS